MTDYAELQATSNYSFLRGGSHPGELVLGAEALGLKAIGIADRNTLAGVVRAWTEAKALKVRALTGARIDFAEPFPSLIAYPTDRAAYGRLSRLLTLGQRRAEKGDCHLFWRDFLQAAEGQAVLVVPPARLDEAFEQDLHRLARELRGNVWLAAARGYGAQDLRRLSRLDALARSSGAPMCAVGDVLYHGPERRPLQDVLTCIREGCTITQAGLRLEANAERCLKSPREMARLFKPWPRALDVSLEIAGRIGFDLGQISYQYPDEPVPEGWTAMAWLTHLTWEGAKWRYPSGVREKERQTILSELKLIEELDYPHYFLTVHDIVRWAREQDILCQGRGSAANSVVCFCLGITAVDPTKPDQDLLFARFLSKERDEPPDIDVDFEHERREEVMQYIYQRYGRDRAAICATVIHYRPRSAIRDVGKALGLTEDITAALAGTVWGSWGSDMPQEQIRQAGLDPDNPEIARAVTLAEEIMGFPRHLSQHVGGYVLTQNRLDETVPIGNAAMQDRTFIEWDKDDIDSVGLMKVDILALGMLSCIKRALNLLSREHGFHYGDIAEIPQECPAVYEMLSRADSVGVFQVESRAQMSMLPRLRPKKFYDLVIEVAIVRPGPIQGDMVHPYLKRRNGQEPVDFPRPAPEHGPPDELKAVLGKTFGVPLFQEQAMRLAIEAARFSPDEANGLRRAMATFRSDGTLWKYKTKFIEGMTRRGYEEAFAARCFKQIEGFGSYGFPESHAISFAILVYVSAWLKCWWPDVFCAAIINSLPMGFYQPAQLVRDARDHGVEVRAADVMHSDWDCTLEAAGAAAGAAGRRGWAAGQTLPGYKAVRLGLRQVKGLREPEIEAIIQARQAGPVADLPDLARRARLSQRSLELLAEADAFRSLGLDRRAALWAVKGMAGEGRVERDAPLLAGLSVAESQPDLPGMGLAEHVAEDYRTTSLSLKAHPMSFFRARLQRMGCVPCDALAGLRNGQKVKVGGLVLIRQRPGTAKGVVFVTLEDETGPANAVVWQDRFQANRRVVMSSSFLVVEGRLQIAEGVIHVVGEKFTDLSADLADMREEGQPPAPSQEIRQRLVKSRDFH